MSTRVEEQVNPHPELLMAIADRCRKHYELMARLRGIVLNGTDSWHRGEIEHRRKVIAGYAKAVTSGAQSITEAIRIWLEAMIQEGFPDGPKTQIRPNASGKG